MKKLILLACLPALLSACSSLQFAPPVQSNLNSAQVEALRSNKRLEIRLFRSYGNEEQLNLRARVIKAENQKPESPSDWALLNFWRNLTSLSVKEVAGIQVQFNLNGQSLRLASDKEGMILLPATAFGPMAPGLYTLSAELVPGQKATAPVSREKMVIQARSDKSLGIVSDIDDTIKLSSVTSKLTALRRLLFNNSYTSEPIPGASVLYQRLEKGLDGLNDGDITYISGSPINLAEYIYKFMDYRGFPSGAVELKKWGFGAGDDSPLAQQSFKLERLRQLFAMYPSRPFLLFGDSGEKDPEIYKQIAQEYPGRVKGIFINNVTQGKPTDARFQGVYLTQNALDAAQILLQQGLLGPEDVEAVRQAVMGRVFHTHQTMP